MRPRIVLGGSLAQKPGRGGHTWVLLQYLLGFKRLGWDVLFLDRLEPDMGARSADESEGLENHPGLDYVAGVFERFGLEDAWAVSLGGGARWVGRSRSRVLDFVESSVGLINVMGFVNDEAVLSRAPVLAFLDIDPGFPQIWRELGLHDAFDGYDRFVTIGERLGDESCLVPDLGLPWIRTPQPVVLSEWPAQDTPGRAFTSVASWRGSMAPLEYGGRTLGLRVHEFRRFLPLPRRVDPSFEIALDIHPDETADLAALAAGGWRLLDPLTVAGDPWTYRRFIQDSAAELMVAKNLYVESRVGWFSDRSICYLASGRPVVAQDTGLPTELCVDRGLLRFDDLESAVAGIEAVVAEPALHAKAAREVAVGYFDSDRVLPRLVEACTGSDHSNGTEKASLPPSPNARAGVRR